MSTEPRVPHALRLAAPVALALLLPLAGCASRVSGASGSGRGAAAPTTARAPVTPAAHRPAPAPAPARAAAAPAATPAAGPIPFDARDQTLAEAMRASGGRPVAMYFLASWCGFCRKMESKTLSTREVQAEMRGWYSVAVDPDTPAGSRLAGTYTSGGFPTTVLFDASGNVRQRLVGARDPALFVEELRANR